MIEIVKTFAEGGKEAIQQTVNNLPNSNGVGTGNLNNVLFWVIGMAGIIAVGVIVYGGVKFILAQGDPGKVKQASQIIAYALVGLIVITLAGVITAFTTGAIGGAAKP